mgnify:CR=1 FL=1
MSYHKICIVNGLNRGWSYSNGIVIMRRIKLEILEFNGNDHGIPLCERGNTLRRWFVSLWHIWSLHVWETKCNVVCGTTQMPTWVYLTLTSKRSHKMQSMGEHPLVLVLKLWALYASLSTITYSKRLHTSKATHHFRLNNYVITNTFVTHCYIPFLSNSNLGSRVSKTITIYDKGLLICCLLSQCHYLLPMWRVFNGINF